MTATSSSQAHLALAGAAGCGLADLYEPEQAQTAASAAPGRAVLYWYDPMVPAQYVDKPGKSPMGMEMTPHYADAGAATSGVQIDPNLGVRLATVERADFARSIDATGMLDFNQRDVAINQARAAGFVQRVYARAPGDVVGAGAPIADLLVPSWGGAQAEYLPVRGLGSPSLEAAVRQRLRLLGMPGALITAAARDGRPRTVVTASTPLVARSRRLTFAKA
jgi:Cu(I)/Ag(I) efflux system membrane fusion protein